MIDCAETETLLTQLAQTPGASDLIITAGPPLQLRIYNELVAISEECLLPEDTERLCLALLNSKQKEQFDRDKELDISYCIEGVGRFRINFYWQRNCLAMAARVIRDQIMGFQELRLPRVVRDFAGYARGLVLITGPIGSGKSTTVAAMVDYINHTRKCHVVCIEDPIEFSHKHAIATIDQREVGIDTESFGEALRRVLRQSMDVVVIGEIRDRTSAQAALTLAETGHLTLATLHTNGTVASVNRLLDMFGAEQVYQVRMQLAASLAGVVWQQLLPAANGEGLVVACEVMKATRAIRSLIRHGRMHEIYSLIQTGRKHEMWTMQQAVDKLAGDGLIDAEWMGKEPGMHY